MEKDLKDNQPRKSKWLLICFPLMMIIIFLIVLIPLGLFYLKPYLEGQRQSRMLIMANATIPSSTGSASSTATILIPTSTSIPVPKNLGRWTGTVLDTRTWLDLDFNTTFTDSMVAGLPLMGLYSEWSDQQRPNPYLPALETAWPYGEKPIHGVELSGWFRLVPEITHWLGKSEAEWSQRYLHQTSLTALKSKIESHYANFITEQDFAEIAEAGLDHVRIPIGYWLLRSPSGDAHLGHVGWRYFVRSLEWARKYGLRVCVKLESDVIVPPQFMQEVANQLQQFLAQERYTNLVTMIDIAGAKSDPVFRGLVFGETIQASLPSFSPPLSTPQAKIAQVCDWTVEHSVYDWDLNDDTTNDVSSIYRIFLKHFAKSQVAMYEQSWGWFFTGWKGPALKRSYKDLIESGIVPNFNATGPAMEFICDASTDYELMGLTVHK